MKRLIILALTLTVGLSACDVLDLEPKDRVTQFDYFKTANDLELFSNPFYNNLLDKEPFDEQSDLLVQNTLSAILFGGSHRTVPESGGGWSWTDLRRMNTLLEYADMCEDKEAVTKYTAVTRFFRAFFYFEKVKRFGDVPWYDIQLGSADELLYKPRDSRELILTKMLEDIDYAINSGGLTESAADPYHVNKWAALALKAQFCLYEGTYRKYHNLNLDGHDANFYLDLAAKAAHEIIEKGPDEGPMFETTVAGYQPVKFVQDPTSNSNNNDRVDSSDCDMPVYRFGEVLLIYAEAKAELGTLTQDDLTISINKLRDRVGMPPLDMAKANAKPDWYLSSEEYGYPNVTGANAGVILEIRRERTIELLQEGHRFEDLVRWKAGTCIDQAITGMYFPGPGEYDLTGDGKADLILYAKGSAKPSADEGVYVYELGTDIFLSEDTKGYMAFHKDVERTKFNEGRDYLYPIPSGERSLNKNLTQNPGWNDGLGF